MVKKLEVRFTCPDCEEEISPGTEVCPGCGLEIEWDEDDKSRESAVDSLLDEIIHECGPETNGSESIPMESTEDEVSGVQDEVTDGTTEYKSDGVSEVPISVEPIVTPSKESKPQLGSAEDEKYIEEEGDTRGDERGEEESKDEDSQSTLSRRKRSDLDEGEDLSTREHIEDKAERVKGQKKLYGNTLSSTGVLFVTLTVLFVAGIIVLYNWDVWVKGSSEISIGEKQTMAMYGAILFLVVFAILSLHDIMKNRRSHGA